MDATTNNQSALLKKAFLAIQDLEAKLEKAQRAASEPIAIIGIGCRLPGGVNDPESFWQLLRSGRDAVSLVPPDRWDREAWFDPDPDRPGKMVTRHGAFLERADGFDAAFFEIAPREAASMDPQQRLALEVAVEALENAGCAPAKLHRTRTGVFLGIAGNDFMQRVTQAADPELFSNHYVLGVSRSVAAGRISYVLGLQGPSIAVDTACSSSLVAVHLACQSLRAGECTLALAGGVNLILVPETTALLSRLHMLSPQGTCSTFDENADGFVRGEGCGFITLKRLSQAQADGDRILALIRGSAVNQDGASSSLTAPNGPAQESLMRDALAHAGLTPGQVSYVEAHGTGTALGDPIELQGLGAVYGTAQPEHRSLLVGSLKTNMGHLEAAAGIAGLIKTALALEHRQIPPHLHLRQPTSRVNWTALRLDVPRELAEWDSGAPSRIAAVSSFGFSGTNAHVILEEAPSPAGSDPAAERPIHVLAASARTPAALTQLIAAYRRDLEEHPDRDLQDVCFTANTGRSHWSSRVSFAAPDTATMLQELANYSGPASPRSSKPGRVGFLFTGQGSQYREMGRELYESSEVFRGSVERCSAEWERQAGVRLVDLLYTRGDELKEALVAQPALFAVEYALAELWRSWGIEPALVLGHSLGEYVASVTAGLLSLEDGLRLVHARAELMDRLTVRGAMRAVATTGERVSRALQGMEGEVAIAAINGPESVVISGAVEAVAVAARKLESEGIRTRELEVSHAFHSPLLEPILDEFERRAAQVRFGKPRLRIVSNLTGRLATAEEMGRPRYWREHMRHTIQFHACLQTALTSGCSTFIEIGPQPHLLSQAKMGVSDPQILWLPSMRRGRDAWIDLLSAVRALYEDGAEIDWSAVHEKRGRKVTLPTYPWQWQSYPLPKPAPAAAGRATADVSRHPLLGARLASPLEEIQFQSIISPAHPAWLADHALNGQPLVPAAGYLDIALSAARFAGLGDVVVESAAVLRPCIFDEPRLLQCVLSRNEQGASFAVHSSATSESKEWMLHATGQLTVVPVGKFMPTQESTLTDARSRCSRSMDVAHFYQVFEERGLSFGPGFRPLTTLSLGTGEAVAEFAVPAEAREETADFVIHPVALDACIQTVAAAVMTLEHGDAGVALPVALERLQVHGDCRKLCLAWAAVEKGSDGLRAKFCGFDGAGNLLVEAHGLIFRAPVPLQQTKQSIPEADLLYQVEWIPLPSDIEPFNIAAGQCWLLYGAAEGAKTLSSLLEQRGIAHSVAASADALMADGSSAVTDIAYIAPASLSEDSRWSALQNALQVAQSIAARESGTPQRFWIMTHFAQGPELSQAADASIWGLARSLALEYPGMRVIRMDLNTSSPSAQEWLRGIAAAGVEDEIVIREAGIFVPRLRRAAPANPTTGNDSPFELTIAERGTLEALQFTPVERRPPGPGEVEIEVRAAGLNFRDVLNVLGMYKGQPGPLGGECAGVVTRVGSGGSVFQPGDEVITVKAGSFRRFLIASADQVWRKPARISFAAAATLPIAFLTARYALQDVAQLQPGQSVLIHAGAGGVGLAAIQVARAAGAVIFATAGSEEKRNYLRGLGVSRVMNSRSADFAQEILEATDGRGVDVVLNSLVGPLIDAGFAVLAPGGRFLELGVADLRSEDWVRSTRPDVGYFRIDLIDRNALVARLIAAVLEQFEAGILQPLPHAIFQMDQAQDAFRWMAQARHIGKIALVLSRTEAITGIRRDGAYLVTGGLSGVGLEVAKWLARRGAGEVVVIGRRAPSPEAVGIFESMRDGGTAVTVLQGDVSRECDVISAIATRLPLRGVFHCAGVLDDAALVHQDWSRFVHVLAGKAQGARHLDRLTRNAPLDYFVLFSSIAAVLGSPGQSNYAAANACLDALAQQRRAANLAAVSINWGAWQETGMAVRHGVLEHSARTGMRGLSTEEALGAMQNLTEADAGPQVMVLAMNWRRFFANAVPPGQKRLLSDLEGHETQCTTPEAGNRRLATESWVERLDGAPRTQQRTLLRQLLEERIRTTLRLPREQVIAPEQPLHELGLDSLLSIELRNSVGSSLRRTLPATLLFNYPTLAALTDYLATLAGIQETARQEERPPRPQQRSILEDIEALSDEEVERMLSHRGGRERTGQEVL